MKPRKAWAIVDRFGRVHLDKIMASRAEAWGLLSDEYGPNYGTVSILRQQHGYRCVRVEIKACRRAPR